VIERPTVFILGAGSSIPYGFSSGEGLLQQARRLHVNQLKDKLRLEQVVPVAEIRRLHDALQRTHDASIDALLELRDDCLAAGRALIATMLLREEEKVAATVIDPERDWLTVLFRELTRGTTCLQDFARNNVTFMTYNYERFLEHRLLGALAVHYNAPDAECVVVLNRLRVLHMHGYLGPLPLFKGPNDVPFGVPLFLSEEDDVSYLRWRTAIAHIKIIHEVETNNKEFSRAHAVLAEAERVIFLGFGFHEKNVERLHPENWNRSASVHGTAYGMTPSERHYYADQPLNRNGMGFNAGRDNEDCKLFLRNRLDLLR
jgi:hypothetical protein